MQRISMLVLGLVVVAGCHKKSDEHPMAVPQAPAPAKEPVRTAVKDSDLRVMLSELASAKACEMIQGQFRPLRDPRRPGVVPGILWLNACKITQHGTQVTFHLGGEGWQWADQSTTKVGATFSVRDYVKFAAKMTIPGALDLSYDDDSHVATVWFTPSKTPEVEFTPLGKIDVDREGTWASIVGGLGSVFGKSPESEADKQAKTMGTTEMTKQMGGGLTVTVALCTGLMRFGLGRPADGKMVAPDVGETHKVPAELEPGAVMVFGPYLARDGMTAKMHSDGGAVRAELMCHDDGQALARSYAEGTPSPRVKPLASKIFDGDATLKVRAARCPLVVVVRPLGASVVTLDWQRPPAEAAIGPMIHCRD